MITHKSKVLLLAALGLVSSHVQILSATPGIADIQSLSTLNDEQIALKMLAASHLVTQVLTSGIEAMETLNTEEIVSKDEPLAINWDIYGRPVTLTLSSATSLPSCIAIAKRLVETAPTITGSITKNTLLCVGEIKEILGTETCQQITALTEEKQPATPEETPEVTTHTEEVL